MPADKLSAFGEFDEVSLARSVEVHGIAMPEGSTGVVMAAYADGLAYEVEFESPVHAVLTVEGADLRATAGIA